MRSNISEYCMHPDKIWLILFDFFIETISSPERKWRHEHQRNSHPSTHSSLIPIYLDLLAETTESECEIIHILLCSSDDARIVRYKEYAIHSIREIPQSLDPDIICKIRYIKKWELFPIENLEK